ncbi:uncharacterized protein HKW66_Vig0102200 [Vigna angularis]|uniref:Uncharacterized protein n=1 Tax=Phaseolus angularis TaxID=3914 RepID=A0A8T0KJN2_PHAAN|nr:uncharacterized protein HKW66_Vig0102200 [Vigna angularis]
MDYVENMDRDFEADNLGIFSDWNDDDFQPTFLQTDTALTDLDDANLMEHFNSQIELPPLPSSILEPMTETIDHTLWPYEGSGAPPLTFVPNPLPPLQPNTPLLNPQQLDNLPSSSSSGEGLMLDALPTLQSQDMTLAGYFNQLSELQNANSVSIDNNNYNVFNTNQSSSYPGLLHQNTVSITVEKTCLTAKFEGRPGNTERTQSCGPFAQSIRSTLFTQHDDASNSRAAWSSRPEHFQFSASDVYGAQYAPNYTQSPQPFSQVQNQIDHASNLQQVLDLHSQDSRRSVYPTFPRSEPFSNLQPGSVTMQSNPFQQGYRSILPNLGASSGSSVSSYGQNPSLFATSSNSFGSGSSLLPQYPYLYGNQDQHHLPQVMMPNNQGQQNSSSMQQWSQIGEYNQRMTTSNLQRQISTSSSQALISRFMGHSSSRVSNSREAGIASGLRSEPSDAIQRILNMNPSRMINRNVSGITDQNGIPTERVPYVPPRRGRPPKRREPIESYVQRSNVSTETGRRGSSTSQRTNRMTNSIVIRDQSAVRPNRPSAPRLFDNAVYDMGFERQD